MRRIHRELPHAAITPVVRSALLFAERRRATRRRAAWRNIILFWRQKRKAFESVRARPVALTAGAIRLAQFHLHFVIGENARAPRHTIHGLSPVTLVHPTQVVMQHWRTFIQSKIYRAQAPGDQSPIQGSSLHQVQGDWSPKLKTTAQHPSLARKPIAPAITTWRTVRSQSPDRQRTRSRVSPGRRIVAREQTLQTIPTYSVESPLFRSRSAAMRYLVPPRSQEGTPAQLYFQPQTLIWRRATQPADKAGNTQKWALDAGEERPHGRSFTGKEADYGTFQYSGSAPPPPVVKMDSAMLDRLTDDVIRRVERRARIERARQGL